MSVEVIHGDCREQMASLIEKNILVDAIVTDPPYHLTSSKNASKGFMGKDWDGGNIAFDPEVWKLCLQLLKPGGHLLAFSGSRTYHRMTVAIEDAGFEIRDQIMWLYGSGFPKSLNISKAIDKKFGAEREVVATKKMTDIRCGDLMAASQGKHKEKMEYQYTAPATDEAKKWDGWGTALKPAHEPICLARKPISKNNVADNVLEHDTGGLNIDCCRVGDEERFSEPATPTKNSFVSTHNKSYHGKTVYGRWPANVIHDGSDTIENEFASFGVKKSGANNTRRSEGRFIEHGGLGKAGDRQVSYGDSGSVSRFFYCAKVSPKERMGLKHPTIKPIALMRYLCRLVTPENGTVLDPFAGTGTTGIAVLHEGFNAVLIEREQEYCEYIHRRIDHMKGSNSPLLYNLD